MKKASLKDPHLSEARIHLYNIYLFKDDKGIHGYRFAVYQF